MLLNLRTLLQLSENKCLGIIVRVFVPASGFGGDSKEEGLPAPRNQQLEDYKFEKKKHDHQHITAGALDWKD